MTINANAKKAQRDMLNKLVADYLANGGIIHHNAQRETWATMRAKTYGAV